MLRVRFKKDVTEEQVQALLDAIHSTSYGVARFGYAGASHVVASYNADPLDVTNTPPSDLPVEMIEVVTLYETIARFFRNDGKYKFLYCRITAEVVRTDKAGAPVQQVHVAGPTVKQVVEAYDAFRDHDVSIGGDLKRTTDWGGSSLGTW